MLPGVPSFSSRYRPSQSLDFVLGSLGQARVRRQFVDGPVDILADCAAYTPPADVTVDLPANADENDSVSGRISSSHLIL